MPVVQTIHGPISADALGTTLMHEHVIFDFNPDRRGEAIAFAIKLLQEADALGMRSLVELTPTRQISWLVEIAAAVPEINLICSTGYYLERLTPEPLRDLGEDEMAERFVRELTEGIDDSGVRAGIIKIAANRPELTDWEKRVFRAAARAQRQTGAHIATHACSGARNQLDYLVEHGVDPNKVFFSHVEAEFGWEGRTLQQEADYLLAIVRQGGWLLFNNFGFEWDTPWADLVYLLRYLMDKGYRERLLISMDANWTWNKEGRIEFEAERDHPGAERRTYAYMFTDAVPALRQAGFSEEDITAFLVGNPQLYFSL
jgi:phosphotriesterase-related protein